MATTPDLKPTPLPQPTPLWPRRGFAAPFKMNLGDGGSMAGFGFTKLEAAMLQTLPIAYSIESGAQRIETLEKRVAVRAYELAAAILDEAIRHE